MPHGATSTQLRPLPAIAMVLADGAPVAPLAGWADGTRFANVEQLIAASVPVDAIVLCPADAAQARRWLQTLRRDARHGLKLILLAHSFGDTIDALSDGLVTSAEPLLKRAAALRRRLDALERSAPVDSDDRLLTFLYLRGSDYQLEPVADWRDERLYYYPLADLFSSEREDGYQLLERLRQRGLLEHSALVERLHICPDCNSAHLLFNEQCPQCGSIDIAEQNFLHCYACGNVSPQQDYLGRDGLRCPKCTVRLRHIGVDYDRALETLACRGCASRFTEPQVHSRCLLCRKEHATDALIERRFHGLRLSDAGEHAARTGSTGDLFQLIDELSQAHPAYFVQTLDWQIALSRRHRDVHFALVALKFSNVQALMTQLPRPRVAQMFDALAQRLRELVRTTDLFMRDEERLCWLLLPQTSAAGLAVLRGRIEALSVASTQDGGQRIELAIGTVISQELAANADARVVMASLGGALH